MRTPRDGQTVGTGERRPPVEGSEDPMGHHKDNDELREDRFEQDKARQEMRDEVFADTDGDVDDQGSQDERRKDGLDPASRADEEE
ncbi:Uncharacterised protein [Mycobacteroides abscessus subsp. abscessus]|nr:Uncharacterised protein [Mycobacteroides abscessus subsp. abscessus]